MRQKNINTLDVMAVYEDAEEDRELWDRVCDWFEDKAEKLEEKADRLKRRRQKLMDADAALC